MPAHWSTTPSRTSSFTSLTSLGLVRTNITMHNVLEMWFTNLSLSEYGTYVNGYTVEVMKLAMTGSPKTLSFISSVAVAFDQGLSVVTEDQYGTKLQQERKAGGSYAAGYGASKWACEVLLQRASEEYGVPVKIFRSSLILAHREWLGQINASDFLTRLLCGLIYTNLAPASFLAQPQGKNHFDGSPVDFVAEVSDRSVCMSHNYSLYWESSDESS